MPAPQQKPLVNLDAVMDLFGKPAGWMLHWGNTAVFFLFVGLIIASALIRFPDKIDLLVQVSTPAPPAQLVTNINGIVSEVLAKEGDSIQYGQAILLLDNPAKRADMLALEAKVLALQKLKYATDVLDITLTENLDVGALGTAYVALINYATTLTYWLKRSKKGQQAGRLNQQINQRKKQDIHLKKQLEQLSKEQSLVQRNTERYELLLRDSTASPLQAEKVQAELLQAQLKLENQENLILQNKIQIEALELNKINLSEQLSDEINEQWMGFKHQLRTIIQGVNNWRDNYLLIAKAEGVLSYAKAITVGQYLEAGQQLGYIVPSQAGGKTTYIAEGYLSGAAIGKIKPGQAVFIALDAYPYREFGQLKAVVAQIALAPNAKNNQSAGYRILLDLPEELKTTYGTELAFRQQLKGRASIITEDRSFLNRIFDRFKDLQNNE